MWWLLAGAMLAGMPARAVAQPVPAAALEARAQELYQQGRARFFAGAYDEAHAAFRASLDLVDSPNTRMYLGRALQRLGRLPDAWAQLDRAARDADVRSRTEPRYAPTVAAARAEADAIAPSLAWLEVAIDDAPEGAELRVDDASLQRAAWGVALPRAPGPVTVRATAPGRRDASRTIELAAGARERVSLALERVPDPEPPVVPRQDPPREDASTRVGPRVPPPPPLVLVEAGMSPVRVGGIVSLAAGGALLATGGIFGLFAWNQYEQLQGEQRAGRAPDPAITDSGERNRDIANGLFVAGGVAAAAGLVMVLVGGRASTPAVTLAPGVGAVALGGRF